MSNMKELVDIIIEVDFNDLNSKIFPKNELFGLICWKDDIKYEFLINLKSHSDLMLIIGSGAVGPRKHIRSRPFFNRWSWDFEDSVIFYNDPTLYINNEILCGWGIGTKENWYLLEISKILKKIFNQLNIYSEELLFYGSSAGGFMSLMLSIMFEGSTALVDIPQFYVNNWYEFWKPIMKYGFDEKEDAEFISNWGYRLKVSELIKKRNYVPNAFILMDCTHNQDFNFQLMPFINELNLLPFNCSKNTINFFIRGKNIGHEALSQKDFNYYLKIIKNIILQKNEMMLSKINNDYDIIFDSGLFDEEYYRNNYLIDKNVNCIKHYLKIGVYKYFNPSPNFNTKFYLDEYLDVRKSGLNPFVHYIIWGIGEGRKSKFI